MPRATGEVLNNRYRIVKLLGQGGFGAVYRAWDLTFEAPCAIKESNETSPEGQRQFLREARLLFNLRHPNLPQVKDFFVVPDPVGGSGASCLVMDFVDGEDLEEKLRKTGGPLNEAEALSWIAQVCEALTYLHTQNPPVIHRDIKPANVKITPEGRAMLVDFGIAKIYDPLQRTTIGARAVTPGFSPVEQYGFGRTDQRSDVYSLGATLYTLLTGQPPLEAPQRSPDCPLPPPRQINPKVSIHIESALIKALEYFAAGRFQTVADFQAELTLPATPPQSLNAASVPWSPQVISWQSALQSTPHFAPADLQPTILSRPPGPPLGMVLIPAGKFQMGSRRGNPDERPIHEVFLDAYFIDIHEVTNEQFTVFLNERDNRVEGGSTWFNADQSEVRIHQSNAGWQAEKSYSDHPVVGVNWFGAKAYCTWRGARLPTEAEWEKAARGGLVGALYPWGNDPPSYSRTNYWGVNRGRMGGTTPVGHYPANDYGLFDMAGNIWEWVADWYHDRYYWNAPVRNPVGPPSGDYHVIRGGAWSTTEIFLRVAARSNHTPLFNSTILGFRCARSI